MDLIYTDASGKDIGILNDYTFDLAYGRDENSFELEMSLSKQCCRENFRLYIENTEYGGIIDTISVETEKRRIIYSGRTWHGVLAGHVICPEKGYDYYEVSGDANAVLAELIRVLELTDIFEAEPAEAGIDIPFYQFRYVDGYSGICRMLSENSAKLRISYKTNRAVLSAVPLIDYSQDEEWDSSRADFKVKKNYRPINHLICLGSGDLKDRHVIHLFTDEAGGIQDYAHTDSPVSDADYIIDMSKQVMRGIDEVTDIYDYPNAESAENYVAVAEEPGNWNRVYQNYFHQTEDGEYERLESKTMDVYVQQIQQPYDWANNYTDYYFASNGEYKSVESVSETVYTVQSAKPSDWSNNYGNYYILSGSVYKNASAKITETYTKQSRKPTDWSKKYENYFYYWSDGVTGEYRKVSGAVKYKYTAQTRKPSDWSNNYGSYYVKKKTGGYKNVEPVKKSGKESAPTWKAKKYYTKISYHVAPKWQKNMYYTYKKTESAPTWTLDTYYSKSIRSVPTWAAGKYYTKIVKMIIPSFLSGVIYELRYDHYAELVAGGIKKLEESYDCDEISIDLDLTGTYDIGDIVGSVENTTGISVWQPITKKIVKIKNNKETVSYEIG